jgi:DNA-binding transcriptional LysR family regulator
MHLRMDWRTVRFDWNRARAFLVTAEEGSLSAAARALGMSQPTLGRQVDALEQELDVLLFERIGKRLVLTEPGMDLLEHVRAMGDAASRVSLAASGQSQALEGTVTITVGEMFAAYVLPPILSKLRAREPGIDIEIVASNTPSDLRRREADIAIRNFRPTDPELVARKVRDMAGHLYAATSYLDRLGRPITLAKLNQADFVGFARTPALIDRLRPLGLELSQKNFVLISENQLVQWALIKQGLGLGVMSEVIGDNEPLVERALPEIEAVMFPVWLASHRELHTSRRVRVVFDLLADELARV